MPEMNTMFSFGMPRSGMLFCTADRIA